MAACHCYLLWRWWSHTLWVMLIRLWLHSLSSHFQVVVQFSLQFHRYIVVSRVMNFWTSVSINNLEVNCNPPSKMSVWQEKLSNSFGLLLLLVHFVLLEKLPVQTTQFRSKFMNQILLWVGVLQKWRHYLHKWVGYHLQQAWMLQLPILETSLQFSLLLAAPLLT